MPILMRFLQADPDSKILSLEVGIVHNLFARAHALEVVVQIPNVITDSTVVFFSDYLQRDVTVATAGGYSQ